MKRFPVLLSYSDVGKFEDCPKSVPWECIEPYEWQARRNHGQQSLQRLAERGGLDPTELVAVMERRSWRPMAMWEAINRLNQLISEAADGDDLDEESR